MDFKLYFGVYPARGLHQSQERCIIYSHTQKKVNRRARDVLVGTYLLTPCKYINTRRYLLFLFTCYNTSRTTYRKGTFTLNVKLLPQFIP
jgi:hypothetical protein